MKTTDYTQADVARKFLTKPGLGRRYGISQRTVDNWMKHGVIPFIKIGRKFIRFDADDCDRALTKFKTKSKI
jgi:predicted site-specific integrase-resolvase